MLFFLSSCDSNDAEDKAAYGTKVSSLFSQERELVYVEEACDTLTGDCVSYRVNFPEFFMLEPGYKGEPAKPLSINGNVAARINRDILRSISSVDSVKSSKSPKALFKKILSKYKSDKEEIGIQLPAYSLRKDIEILNNKYGILSLLSSTYQYYGGAHGIREIDFANYDLYKNEKLTFDSIFNREDLSTRTIKEELTKSAIRILADSARRELGSRIHLEQRELLKMPDREVLERAGYMDMSKFTISENIGILPKGILFLYNEYEIAPYAMGPIEVFMPFDSISKFFPENAAIRRLFVEEIQR